LVLWIVASVFENEAFGVTLAEKHLKRKAEHMKKLHTDFIVLKKSNCDDNKMWHTKNKAKNGHEHKTHWAVFIWRDWGAPLGETSLRRAQGSSGKFHRNI
jgi:hypothetical protein